jgi:hypothetical protein
MPVRVDPDDLERRAAEALEVARRRAGLSVEAMVRSLRPALRLPDLEPGKAGRHNWYDWRRRPHSIPAVALLAAAQIAGLPLDVLLSESDAPSHAQSGRLESLERQVAELSRRLEQRERADQEVRVPRPSGVDVEAVIATLEDELEAVGRQLGRRWETAIDEEEDSLGSTEIINRRVGRLEARIVEVSGMVGAPFGGYPPAPASLQDQAFDGWLQVTLGILHQQLALVQQRVPKGADVARDARRAGRSG